MVVLNDSDVEKLLSWSELISALEIAFAKRQDEKSFFMPDRQAIELENATLLSMPCADSQGWFGIKQVSVVPENYKINKDTVQAQYTLFDPSGTPVLTSAATLLTKFRTAAVSALAAKYLVRDDAKNFLMIGTGALAPFMIKAHVFMHDYKNVRIWGRDKNKAEKLALELSKDTGVEIEVFENLADALVISDVVSIATTSLTPIVFKEMTHSGQHFDIVGAFRVDMLELEPNLIKSSAVFVDDIPSCKLEAGDLIQAEKQGWSFEEIRGDLSQLVRKKVGRKNDNEITVFKSVGLALEDLVAAKILHNKVK